jgi:hypothetical protein
MGSQITDPMTGIPKVGDMCVFLADDWPELQNLRVRTTVTLRLKIKGETWAF